MITLLDQVLLEIRFSDSCSIVIQCRSTFEPFQKEKNPTYALP